MEKAPELLSQQSFLGGRQVNVTTDWPRVFTRGPGLMTALHCSRFSAKDRTLQLTLFFSAYQYRLTPSEQYNCVGAMAHQIPAIYKAALKRYEDTTGEKLNDPSITKLITVGDLTNAIDARNEEFTAFRNKRHKMFAVLSNLVRPVEAFANLTTGAGQMFPPVSLVFGAVLSLINSAKGVSEKYDAITELMETLKVRWTEVAQRRLPSSLVADIDSASRISL